MAQRSILAGMTPSVIVRVGSDVSVEGWDNERVSANTDSRWGLKLEKKSESEIAHVRARAGGRVLLDVGVDVIGRLRKNLGGEVIEVHIGGSGEVYVPEGSGVKVYAGKSVNVRDIRGSVTVYAGGDVHIRNVYTLVHVSAGGAIDFEREGIEGNDVKFAAGRDLRCYIKTLTNAKVVINDLGGYWEALLGDGRTKIRLKAGGDVTLVTDQEVKRQSPNYLLGKIEKPTRTGDQQKEKDFGE